MVQATELRIGNWVRRLNETNLLKVEMIDSSGNIKFFGLDEHLFDLEESGIKPVSLTTEILYNSGFEVYHDNPRLEFFYVNKAGYYPFFIYSDREGNFYHNENLELKYLHQLQNLFFALTGNELPVSL